MAPLKHKRIIRSRAPVRISFGGGGTDVSPYSEDFGGCVINAAISRYAWASLRPRTDKRINISSSDFQIQQSFNNASNVSYDGNLDLIKAAIKRLRPKNHQGFDLYLRSDVPPLSGLGGSASACIAVIGVLNYWWHKNLTRAQIAALAHDIEREELNNAGGKQDQYAAVFGGINFLEFKKNGTVKISKLKLKPHVLFELEKSLALFNLNQPRVSGDIIKDEMSRYKSRENIQALHRTKKIALDIKSALLTHRPDHIGPLLHKAWQEKKKFSPLISTAHIDNLYASALRAGASGGKITGAGGGGHILFHCKPDQEYALAKTVEATGAKQVPFRFDTDGLQVWEV